MSTFLSSSRRLCLGGFLLLAPLSSVFARDGDDVPSKMQVAWDKFSERQELVQHYGARAEVAQMMLQLEHQRTQLATDERMLKIQIDSFPHRRNNLQEEVYQQWLYTRQQLTSTDQTLAELRLQMQHLNEQALLEAQAKGKRVKPFDRIGLLNEFHRVDREGLAAYVSLQKAVDAESRKKGQSRADVIQSAMESLTSGDAAARLGSPQPFLSDFKKFLNGSNRTKSSSGGRRKPRR